MREKLMRGKNCLPLGISTPGEVLEEEETICMQPLHSGKILSMFINTLRESAKATEPGFSQWVPVIEKEETFRGQLDMILGNLHWVAFLSMGLDKMTSMHPFQPQPFCDSLKRQQIPILPASSNSNGCK